MEWLGGGECRRTITVVDNRVHDGDIRGTVGVPAISVLGQVFAARVARDIEVVEHHVGAVGKENVVLRRVSQDQV